MQYFDPLLVFSNHYLEGPVKHLNIILLSGTMATRCHSLCYLKVTSEETTTVVLWGYAGELSRNLMNL